VWDALADERTDIVIGATSAVPVASHFTFRDMGLLNWLCVVSARHPLAQVEGLLSDDQLRPFASLCMTDTSRNLPKRDTWTLDNQRRLVVPNWASAMDCLQDGLCVGMVPAHLVQPLIDSGELAALELSRPFPASPSCVAWAQDKLSPAMAWLLDYLGDSQTMNQEWLNGPVSQ
jgi:DNA-binding transcriptional LysR family regulator